MIVDPVGPGSAPRLAGGDRFSSTLVGQMDRQAGLLRTIADSQAKAEMDKYDAKEIKIRTKMGQPIGERQPSTISQIGGALSGLAPVIGGLFGGGGSSVTDRVLGTMRGLNTNFSGSLDNVKFNPAAFTGGFSF